MLARPGLGRSRPPLVGTWRVIRFCDRDSSGAMVEPLGPSPTGLFIYTPTGQLSIQVMRTPPYIGTGQLRSYRMRGDTLSIGAQWCPDRVLLRVD